MKSLTASALAPPDSGRREEQLRNLCTVAQWWAWNGDTGAARTAIERLASAEAADPGLVTKASGCATLLRAILATLQHRPDAPVMIARLDSVLFVVPSWIHEIFISGRFASARLHEMRGNFEGALVAIRRRPRGWPV